MKKFRWPLQRLLDVRARQEQMLAAELAGIAKQLQDLEKEELRQRNVLKKALEHWGKKPLGKRMECQDAFSKALQFQETQIRRAKEACLQCQRLKKIKMDQLLQAKASRETLERLREKAAQEYFQESLREQQGLLDESSQSAFVRKQLSQRAGEVNQGADECREKHYA